MPATYSINVGTALEANRKPDIVSVLKDLPDNTQKLIKPRNVRDAFLSTWAASPFKQTINLVGIEYIGIDSGNPSNRDIKQKILLGKRSFANLDVMTGILLEANRPDIYIYNTKPDTYLTQSSTKMAILAGTDSSLHANSPYIESRVEGTLNHLEIRNPSIYKGPINIFSNTGRVAINGILFPTVAETISSASNGKILKYSGSYPNGYLRWSDISFDETTLGSENNATNIFGSPVNVNGHSLEFVQATSVPNSIGGIPSGFSFSSNSYYSPITATQQNWPLVEVLRKLIYPYTPPVLQLSATNILTGTTYAEANSVTNVALRYDLSIYPRNSDEYISNYYILTQQKFASTIQATQGTSYHTQVFEGLPGSTFSNTINFSVSSAGGVSGGQYTYTMAISDVIGTVIGGYPLVAPYNNFGWSYSTSATINFIKPIYYGFSNTLMSSGSFSIAAASSLTKAITPYPGPTASMNITTSGAGMLYFIYPSQNGIGGNPSLSALKKIKDPNGFVIHNSDAATASAFTYSTNVANGYHIYRTICQCSYSGSEIFEFIF